MSLNRPGDPMCGGEADPTAAGLVELITGDGEGALGVYDLGDGVTGLVVHCPTQRPLMLWPYVSVTLKDWPLDRNIEDDLGPRFVQALELLAAACSGADVNCVSGESP